jgi:hypothetical protein
MGRLLGLSRFIVGGAGILFLENQLSSQPAGFVPAFFWVHDRQLVQNSSPP